MAYWYGILATSTYEGLKLNNCTGQETPTPICNQLFNELANATQKINRHLVVLGFSFVTLNVSKSQQTQMDQYK